MNRAFAVALTLAWVAQPSHAQTGASIEGTIVSSATGRPLAGALVALDAGRRTLSDEEGRFVLSDVVPGPYRIAAVGPGCHVTMGDVEVPGAGVATVAFALDLPAESDPTSDGWDRARRSAAGASRSISGEDIRRRGYRSLLDAVRALAPEMVGQQTAQAGSRGSIQGRSRSTVTGSVEPLVVVDGVRIPQRPADALALIEPSTVRTLEVIKGTAGGWAYGTQAVNGVIRVETVRSSTYAPDTPADQCGFVFPM